MKSRWLVSSVLLLSSLGCDQISKRAAEQWLSGQPAQSYMGDVFRLVYAENSGAFLGLGASWPELMRFIVFTLLSSTIVVFALGWLVMRSWREDPPKWSGLLGGALLLSGGLGNLIDRIAREGAVIDFMNLGIGPLRTGIFNVADVQILVGLGLLLLPGGQVQRANPSVGP